MESALYKGNRQLCLGKTKTRGEIMRNLIEGKIYDTDKSDVVATNDFSDPSNMYNVGRSSTLYKTKKGRFFVEYNTCWQGEHDSLEPVSTKTAQEIYAGMYDRKMGIEEAFGTEIEEA